jgi:outer membrane receptor protein involved in Fe transport
MLRRAALVGVGVSALAAEAGVAQPLDFNIPSQPLPAALRSFGLQSNTSIAFSATTTGYALSAPVIGRFEPEEALNRLLPRGRLAQLRRGNGFTIVRTQAQPIAAQAMAVDQALPAPASPAPSAEPAQSVESETIVVTGSRLARPTGFTTPTPVTVLGQERIRQLGLTSVGDALNTLPSFRATNTPLTANLFATNIGARFADLRGLGPQRTLVLVDGRRFAPSTSLSTVDLNLIPASLIQRTEVVTGGASAAYGSDAVAGVINIILDKKLTGIRGNVQYGLTERGDDRELLISLAAGSSYGEGRGHVIVGGEYDDARGVGDCYSRPFCATNQGTITNPTPGVNGLPAILMLGGLKGANLTPGGVINGPASLQGIQFAPDGTPIPFQRGQFWSPSALFMIGGDGSDQFYGYTGILMKPPVERFSLYGHTDYEFSDRVSGFADLSYGQSVGRSVSAQTRDALLPIQIDNPFLPTPIRQLMTAQGINTIQLGREGLDLGRAANYSKTATMRGAAGLDGKLGSAVRWNLYYQYGRTEYDQRTYRVQDKARFLQAVDAVAGPNGTPVCRVNADASSANDQPACRPLNLFGQFRSPPEAMAFAFGNASQDTTYTQHVVSGGVQINPFELPGGPAAIGGGIEYRADRARGDADPVSQMLGFLTGNGTKINGDSKVLEGYVEASLPLFADIPLVRALELNGAARRTRYDFTGPTGGNEFSVTTWKLGGSYQPIEQLRFRATRSRDIRAPNVSELYAAPSATQTVLQDPVRGTNLSTLAITAANPNLRPEIARTTTAGVSFQPSWLSRTLNISVDYFKIDISDAITRPGTQTVLNRCLAGAAEFCPFVLRDGSGVVSQITNPLFNFAELVTEGVDFEANYRLPLSQLSGGVPGALTFRALATYVAHLSTTDSAGSIDRAGQSGFPAGQTPGVPHWIVDGTVTYSTDRFATTLQGHFIDSGYHDVTRIGPDDPRYDPFLRNSTNRNRLPSRTYFNLTASYNIIDEGRRRLQLFGGVNNLFDKDPPAIHSNSYGTNTVYFDPIGRTFRVALNFSY